jgi:hypothetical protein
MRRDLFLRLARFVHLILGLFRVEMLSVDWVSLLCRNVPLLVECWLMDAQLMYVMSIAGLVSPLP